MSLLLREIKRSSRTAADVLERAELRTDSDIQSLTREELQELFPGPNNFKLRRTIFNIIHKQKPVEQLLRELKEFIPHESFRDALTNNGVMVDYLRILKDMKSQMNYVQTFLDAHIDLLEECSTKQPDGESATCDPEKLHNAQPDSRPQGAQGTGDSDSSGQMAPASGLTGGQGAHGTGILNSIRSLSQFVGFSGQTGGHPQGPQCSLSVTGASGASGQMMPFFGQTGCLPRQAQTVLFYRKVISGRTFDGDLQLMEKLKYRVQDRFLLFERDQGHQVTFVFCPISSRVASDVEAAMTDAKGDEHVILVLMHHTREVKYVTGVTTWSLYANIVLHVSVFYHETIPGLLKCEQNNAAISAIQKKLQECFGKRSGPDGISVPITNKNSM